MIELQTLSSSPTNCSTQQRWNCDNKCGFRGSYLEVVKHEETCIGPLDHPRRVKPPSPPATKRGALPARRHSVDPKSRHASRPTTPGGPEGCDDGVRATAYGDSSMLSEAAVRVAAAGAAAGAAAAVSAGMSVADGSLAHTLVRSPGVSKTITTLSPEPALSLSRRQRSCIAMHARMRVSECLQYCTRRY